MGVILLIQLGLNIAGINLVSLLNQVSVWWHIGVVAAVVVLIFVTGKPDQSGLTFGAIQPQDVAGSWDNNLGFIHPSYGAAITYPLILAFLFSLLQANWTYTGYDASAHVAEETVGARMASAWGVFLSVAVSARSSATSSCSPCRPTCRACRRCSRPTSRPPIQRRTASTTSAAGSP